MRGLRTQPFHPKRSKRGIELFLSDYCKKAGKEAEPETEISKRPEHWALVLRREYDGNRYDQQELKGKLRSRRRDPVSSASFSLRTALIFATDI